MKVSIATSVLVFVVAASVKLLLLPSYHSTDFEVHRNWLAITHSLPISQWYFEDTSEWTLDYPPFFAYFEFALAQVAKFVDPAMLQVDNLNHNSATTILFMRGSVIATDAVLVLAAYMFVSAANMPASAKLSVFLMIVFNAGLLLVDHIHFQYNGILMGLLILCVYCAVTERYSLLALTFSVLVLMKHLFVPLAPIFGIYLLTRFCVGKSSTTNSSFSFARFAKLVSIAVLALAAAFGPFVMQSNPTEQLTQIFSRLFPFGRGLVHAYWAPNVWALYCGLDKILYFAIKKLNHPGLNVYLKSTGGAKDAFSVLHNSASGIVGDFAFNVLPSVSAGVCLLLMFCTLLPAMCVVYRTPTPKVLVHALVYASLCSFMVGYHVHEKAIIIPLLLQTLVVFMDDSSVSADNVPVAASTVNTIVDTKANDTVSQDVVPTATASSSSNQTTTTSTQPAVTIATTLVASARQAHRERVLTMAKMVFGVLGIVGTYSLFPLFYTLPELFTKTAIFIAYVCGVWAFLFDTDSTRNKMLDADLKRFLVSCMVSMGAVYVFCEIVHPILFYDPVQRTTMLAFLPRMLTSIVCALYLCVAWVISAAILFCI
eukprot:gene16506-18833_t